MKKLKPKLNYSNYTIDLTIEQFRYLDSLDYLDDVLPSLEKSGASDIEYSGHFGARIFFNCEPEKLNGVVKQLMKIIQ